MESSCRLRRCHRTREERKEKHSYELKRWDYLSKKYKEFTIAVKKYDVKRRFEYFKKMLEKARNDG